MRLVLLASAMLVLVSCNDTKKENSTVDLSDESKKLSYSLGVVFGTDMQRADEAYEFFDKEAFVEAYTAALLGDSLRIDYLNAEQNLNDYSAKKRENQINENVDKGDAYLQENGQKEGVITLENGIQYEVLQEGNGVHPNESSQVKAHYVLTLVDGEQIQSSYEKGEPLDYKLGQGIEGWNQILPLMSKGAKWRVSIPYQFAYGAEGFANGIIPPYSTLIFDIEIVDVIQ